MRRTPGHHHVLIIGAVAAALLWAGGIARAQDTAADAVEPRITAAQFAAFCQHLDLGRDQASIAKLMFADYEAALAALTTDLDARAMAAGRQSVQDALSGRARIPAEELRARRIAVLKVYEQGFAAADDAIEDLLSGLRTVLLPEQELRFDRAARELRRRILLHPRQLGSAYQEYAGDGVDVLLLFDDAVATGGELVGIDRAAVDPVLAAYEQEMDALLLETADADRLGRLNRKIAAIERDAAAVRGEEQAAIDRWRRLFELNRATVHQIAAIAADSLGERSRRQWLHRFDEASFAWLYPRRKPDRQIEWIRRQNVPPETLEHAEQAYESYVDRRRSLARGAIDLMLRARLEFQTMLYAMMDPSSLDDRPRRSLYEELLKNSGELATLESTTAGVLESALSDDLRKQLRDAMNRPDAPPRRR